MSSTSRAWVVAASVGAVEALKDQSFCRWNHGFRSLYQHAKTNLGSFSPAATRFSSSSSSSSSSSGMEKKKMIRQDKEKVKRSEESLRTVMYLSYWGPN